MECVAKYGRLTKAKQTIFGDGQSNSPACRACARPLCHLYVTGAAKKPDIGSLSDYDALQAKRAVEVTHTTDILIFRGGGTACRYVGALTLTSWHQIHTDHSGSRISSAAQFGWH
eukprot:1536949-Pleurochrysis_carterae.AAC.1